MSKRFTKSRLSLLNPKVLVSLATATVLLTGCGGGGGGSTPPADTTQTAYLIDSAVQGIDYTCGTITGTTDSTGKFTYDTAKCSSVEFSLGGLVLGSINPANINSDTKLTLQELAGTTREDVAHATVQKMAVLLQSLDSDGDSSNGIDINSTTRTNFALTGNLADKTDNEISTEITARGKTVKDKIQALTHLLTSTKAIASSTKIDLVPDAFSFTDLTGQALSSVVESASITVVGIDIASPISVSGGYYKIGSGAWINQPSKVTNGQTVTLKGTASSDYATVTDVTLTIGGVSDTFSIATIGDTIPTAFSFTDVTNVALSTPTESAPITVAGLGTGVSTTISVTGGEYSINGGAYTAIAGTVSNGQTVKVKHTSSGSNATATNTTLTIGGLSDTFTTTTLADTIPTAFTFTDVTNVALSTPTESDTITVAGLGTGVSTTISVTGGEYSINGGAYTAIAETVSNNDTVKVKHTSSASNATATNTTLTIGGLSDTFTTTTLADTIPTAFTFTDVSNITLSTLTESNEITVAGLGTGVSATISVTGGEYSINGGAYTAIAGTVSNGQTVKVKHTSSGSNATATNTTLTIGGLSDTFTTTTLAIPTITFNPSSGSTNVGIYTWIRINFNEDMNSSTILPALTLSGGKTFISCDYNTTTQSALCKLVDNGTFAENTLYTLTGTVKNSANQDRVVDMNFTTGALNTFGRLRTGQTLCYDSANNTIACTDGNALKDDGYYVSQGLGLARSFDRNATSGHETVKDNVTKLIWQDDDSAATVERDWANANSTICQSLNTNTFGGYADWRLPTIEELYTITNKAAYNPAKFSTFSNIVSQNYWSSTTRVSDTSYAYILYFVEGYDSWRTKANPSYVRCVRGGQ